MTDAHLRFKCQGGGRIFRQRRKLSALIILAITLRFNSILIDSCPEGDHVFFKGQLVPNHSTSGCVESQPRPNNGNELTENAFTTYSEKEKVMKKKRRSDRKVNSLFKGAGSLWKEEYAWFKLKAKERVGNTKWYSRKNAASKTRTTLSSKTEGNSTSRVRKLNKKDRANAQPEMIYFCVSSDLCAVVYFFSHNFGESALHFFS